MTKKIYLILFSIVLLFVFSSCKETGSEFLSWRSTNGKTMVNINNGYMQMKAFEDSVLYAGVTTAEVLADIYDISDSLKIVAYGHCVSRDNPNPYIKKNKTVDGNVKDTFTYVVVDTNNLSVNATDSAFKFTSDLYNLKPQEEYYVRTFVIVEYDSGKKDTAYNQTVKVFYTKIPQDIWFHKPDLNGEGRTEAICFVMNGTTYFGTGYDGLNLLDDFWEYKPYDGQDSLGVWEQRGIFKGGARMSAVAFVINDTAYVGTGIIDIVNKTPTGDMWKWSEVGGMYNQWRRIDSLGQNSERYNAIAFSLTLDNGETRGYVGLGKRDFNFNDLMYYKPEADTPGAYPGAAWVNQENFLGGNRSEAMVAVVNNRAFVGGGIDNNGVYQSNFYIFDPTAGTSGKWRGLQQGCPAPARANGTAFALSTSRDGTDKHYFYFGTGRGTGGVLYNDWWRYDYGQGQWFQCSDIVDGLDTAEARQGAIGFSIIKSKVHFGANERGFVGFGQTASGLKKDFWEYLP